MRLRLADPPQSVTQAVQNVIHGAFGRHVPPAGRRVGREPLMHCLRRDPCVDQRCLELRIRLALRLHQGVNLLRQFRVLLFGFATAPCREVFNAANPGAAFAKPCVYRVPSPAKHVFGPTRIPLAVLDRHFRLKLTPSKPRQLPRRALDRLPHRFRQLGQHGLLPETWNSRILPQKGSLTRIGRFTVDHFLRAAQIDRSQKGPEKSRRNLLLYKALQSAKMGKTCVHGPIIPTRVIAGP